MPLSRLEELRNKFPMAVLPLDTKPWVDIAYPRTRYQYGVMNARNRSLLRWAPRTGFEFLEARYQDA